MDQGFEPEPKRIKKSILGFPCYKCEYFATTASNLEVHVEGKHEDVRYPCSQCELLRSQNT